MTTEEVPGPVPEITEGPPEDVVVPATIDPVDTKTRCRNLHLFELKKSVQNLVGSQPIHSRLDTSRGIWQSWVGNSRFNEAELRGEWNTEVGALRRLRNAKNRLNPEAEERRPMPGGGQSQLIDVMDGKRRSEMAHKSKSRSSAMKVAAVAGVTALMVVNLYMVLSKALERPPVSRPTPVAQEAPATTVVVPERVTEESVAAPQQESALPTRSRRGRMVR